jgi:hypothetical protein
VQRIELGAGSTVGDVVRRLGLPLSEVFLALRNARDGARRIAVNIARLPGPFAKPCRLAG